jgi:hypothetical protein
MNANVDEIDELDHEREEVWLLEEVAPNVWRPLWVLAPRDAAEPWRYANNVVVLAAAFDDYNQAARAARRLSRKSVSL